jgi:hypothetical protein
MFFFKTFTKFVILRACDFFDLSCLPHIQLAVLQAPQQSRHPERSASQICRITKGFMARSRRTPAMLVGRCSSELSGHKLQGKLKKSQPLSGAPRRFIAGHRAGWRGVEGPRGCLSCLCRSELFNHRSPHGRTRHGLSLGPRTRTASIFPCPAATSLHFRQPYRHALHWRHQQPVSARHAA